MNKMMKRLGAVLLSAALVLTMLGAMNQPAYAFTYEISDSVKPSTATLSPSNVTYSQVLSAALKEIKANEGSYTSVACNDNGAVSIGFIQWHGTNALQLLKMIISQNNTQAKSILGSKLYNEITDPDTNTWAKRIVTTTEKSYIQKLLATSEGKAAQDKLAKIYITNYMNDAISLGIKNAAALVYYADIANQGGRGGAKICANRAYNLAGSWGKVRLNELHLATMTYSALKTYISRRFSTYGYASALGWTYCASGDYKIPYTSSGLSNCSSAIKWLQTVLNNYIGAGLTVNGVYDTNTKAAVKKLQALLSLTADGDAGYNTVSTLIYERYLDVALGTGELGTAYSITTTNLTVAKTSYTLNDNAAAFKLSVSSNQSESAIKYSSSNKAVASVSSAGKVTVNAAGSATITVSQAATSNYTSDSAKVTVKVYSTDPAKYSVPTVTLGAGRTMKAANVQWLQATLLRLGFTTELVDGKWDSTTTAAVKKFQTSAGLTSDGLAGTMTRTTAKTLYYVKNAVPKLTASSKTGYVLLSWTKITGADGYIIYRKTATGSWAKIQQVKGASNLTVKDSTGKKGTTYYYCMKAYKKAGTITVKSVKSTAVKGVRK